MRLTDRQTHFIAGSRWHSMQRGKNKNSAFKFKSDFLKSYSFYLFQIVLISLWWSRPSNDFFLLKVSTYDVERFRYFIYCCNIKKRQWQKIVWFKAFYTHHAGRWMLSEFVWWVGCALTSMNEASHRHTVTWSSVLLGDALTQCHAMSDVKCEMNCINKTKCRQTRIDITFHY